MYNPTMGGWLQRDPAQEGNNLYEYCGNNPVNLTDPTGRAQKEDASKIDFVYPKEYSQRFAWIKEKDGTQSTTLTALSSYLSIDTKTHIATVKAVAGPFTISERRLDNVPKKFLEAFCGTEPTDHDSAQVAIYARAPGGKEFTYTNAANTYKEGVDPKTRNRTCAAYWEMEGGNPRILKHDFTLDPDVDYIKVVAVYTDVRGDHGADPERRSNDVAMIFASWEANKMADGSWVIHPLMGEMYKKETNIWDRENVLSHIGEISTILGPMGFVIAWRNNPTKETMRGGWPTDTGYEIYRKSEQPIMASKALETQKDIAKTP